MKFYRSKKPLLPFCIIIFLTLLIPISVKSDSVFENNLETIFKNAVKLTLSGEKEKSNELFKNVCHQGLLKGCSYYVSNYLTSINRSIWPHPDYFLGGIPDQIKHEMNKLCESGHIIHCAYIDLSSRRKNFNPREYNTWYDYFMVYIENYLLRDRFESRYYLEQVCHRYDFLNDCLLLDQ